MSRPPEGRSPAPSGAWLAGLFLGALTGLTTISFALGILGLPILFTSLVLILWKGPRAIAATGFLTGWGLLWAVAIVNVTVSCLTIDRGPGRWCEPPDAWPWLAAGIAMFVIGLAASAAVFSRLRRRP